MRPNIGAYIIVLSKLLPNGLSLAKIGFFCVKFVKFSPPTYTSNFSENTFVICVFNKL